MNETLITWILKPIQIFILVLMGYLLRYYHELKSKKGIKDEP